jgi:hypothetical protein
MRAPVKRRIGMLVFAKNIFAKLTESCCQNLTESFDGKRRVGPALFYAGQLSRQQIHLTILPKPFQNHVCQCSGTLSAIFPHVAETCCKFQ